jgi:carboxymethylenebutenolidase
MHRVYDAILAETVTITGHDGDPIEAYLARAMSPGPAPGIVVIHHMPGYDRETKEMTRRFAVEGYSAICPNLYSREAPGAAPDDAAAAARAQGGVPDERLVGDVAGAVAHLRGLSNANGKVGVIGHCSGGRQTVLASCALDVDAAVDCYGGMVVEPPPEGFPARLTPIVERLPELRCPLLGLFGEDDAHPDPQAVATLDRILTEHGKTHEFHSYPGAGHAFFSVDRTAYRPEAALDGWQRIFAWFATHLKG